MSRIFLDTNVLAYQFDRSEPAKRTRAIEACRSDSQNTFVVSTQVLLELFVVITRKLVPALDHHDAARVIDTLCGLPVQSADARLVQRAVHTAGRHQLSVWDALIIEAAAEAGCDELWSEDLNDGAHLRNVVIVNPLAGD